MSMSRTYLDDATDQDLAGVGRCKPRARMVQSSERPFPYGRRPGVFTRILYTLVRAAM